MRQLITFTVDGQSFGFDINAIREIRAYTPVTRLPHVLPHFAGVVNLRGAVLPVVDLAMRLGWRAAEPTSRHVIIVARHNEQLRGFLVDTVSDIVTVPDGGLQPPAADIHNHVAGMIEGVFPAGDLMVMVLDLARLADDLPAMAA